MPDYTSALFCDHANEFPARCICPSNCYCKAHSCRDPNRLADHPPQRPAPPPLRTSDDAFRLIGTFPHCDARVLHKPGDCEYCDAHPDWQALRLVWKVNFTGERDPEKLPCPAELDRPAYQIHQWRGNHPTNAAVPLEPPTRFERDRDVTTDADEEDNRQYAETD